MSCDAAESSHGDFPMSRYYHRTYPFFSRPGILDVTALLTYLHETGPSSLRTTSLYDRGLAGGYLYLNTPNPWCNCWNQWLEVQFQRLAQIH